jgi:hypothetical protein
MRVRISLFLTLITLLSGCAGESQSASQSQVEELTALRQAALSYVPSGLTLEFGKYITKEELERAIKEPSEESNLYVSLALLKLYRHHLNCCNQSYNLLNFSNATDSIFINYVITQFPCRKGNEPFYPSSCAYNWAQEEKMESSLQEIANEMKLIEAELTRIKNIPLNEEPH